MNTPLNVKKASLALSVVLASAALAASGPFRSITVAPDKAGPALSRIESSSAKVYVRLEPGEEAANRPYSVAWFAEDVASSTVKAGQKVVSVDGKLGSGMTYASINRPEGGWPIGTYRAEVTFGGKAVAKLPFEIVSVARLRALSLGAKETGPASSRFSPTSPEVNVRISLAKIDPDGLPLRVRWIADKVEGAPPGYVIQDTPGTMTEAEGAFSLSKPDAGWPVGRYTVEVRLGRPSGPVTARLPFTVSR